MLTAAELAQARRAFLLFDRNSDGVIDVEELRASLQTLGHADVGDAALQVILDEVDKDRSGAVEFSEFVQAGCSRAVVERNKAAQAGRGGEADTLEAFVALGGQADRGGAVSVERLAAILSFFELRMDLARLLEEMDKDADGTVTYEEFRTLLAGGSAASGSSGGSGGGAVPASSAEAH